MRQVILLIIILTLSKTGVAQVTQTAVVPATLTDIIEFTFSSGTNTGPIVTLPFITALDYTNGSVSSNQTLTVKSNRIFVVTIKTNTANFSYSGSVTPAPTMPVSGILTIMIPSNSTGGTIASPFSSSTYASLSSTAQNLINSGANGASQSFTVKYKATPGYDYGAGSYNVDVVYTATQQ
jgi:hypothetical protein